MNLVLCKNCNAEFDYSPGFAGNARQLCDECRLESDRKEIEKDKELTILEGNKYLVGGPGYKNRYDPVEILVEGNMPDLPNEGEKFACAMEIGKFISSKNGNFMGCEENLVKFLDYIGEPHSIVCFQQWTIEHQEKAFKREVFKNFIQKIMKLSV